MTPAVKALIIAAIVIVGSYEASAYAYRQHSCIYLLGHWVDVLHRPSAAPWFCE